MNRTTALHALAAAASARAERPLAVPARWTHVLLLLAAHDSLDRIAGQLRQHLGRVQVTQAVDLHAAMMSAAGPALAVLDSDLCESLELEFIEHLLRVNPDTVVLLVSDEARPPGWPAWPRLLHTSRSSLVRAVEGALSHPSLARAGGGLAVSAA